MVGSLPAGRRLGFKAAGRGAALCPHRDGEYGCYLVVLGIVGWVLSFLFVMILMRMAGGEDRAARHEEKRLDPFSDVSITQTGVG
jgi:hypothetical protein